MRVGETSRTTAPASAPKDLLDVEEKNLPRLETTSRVTIAILLHLSCRKKNSTRRMARKSERDTREALGGKKEKRNQKNSPDLGVEPSSLAACDDKRVSLTDRLIGIFYFWMKMLTYKL